MFVIDCTSENFTIHLYECGIIRENRCAPSSHLRYDGWMWEEVGRPVKDLAAFILNAYWDRWTQDYFFHTSFLWRFITFHRQQLRFTSESSVTSVLVEYLKLWQNITLNLDYCAVMGTSATPGSIKLRGWNWIRACLVVWLRQWKVCWTPPSKNTLIQRHKSRYYMTSLCCWNLAKRCCCGNMNLHS